MAVGDRVFHARHGLVIGTGTAPVIPPLPGLAGTPYWTNREAIEVEELPGSLLVLGGGAIGLELAQVFARFGVRVTVVEAMDRVLAIEEPESSQVAAAALRADGVEIRTGVRAERVDHHGDGFTIHLADGTAVTGERLLVSTGRRARLTDLGLETIGVDPASRFLTVDDRMHLAERVWAVGDVTGEGAFTHVAMYQAAIVVADLLDHVRRADPGADASGTASVVGGALGATSAVGGAVGAAGPDGTAGGVPRADYRALPRVTFTDPEVGAVGLTEQQARDRGINVQVGLTDLSRSTRGWIHRTGSGGLIKLIVDADQGVLIGASWSARPAARCSPAWWWRCTRRFR